MKAIVTVLVLKVFLGLLSNAAELQETAVSKAAVNYLKLLTANEYNLTDHTAISENCEVSRRREIRNELEFYKKTKLRPGDTYKLEQQKIIGNFAAILLLAENPGRPLQSRVHSIAMLKDEDKWLPAPLPGTFVNTGYGYDPKIEKTVRSLEKLMAQEKIRRETSARTQASNNLVQQISLEAKKIKLVDITPQQSAIEFIEAIRSKNLLRTLVIMGMDSTEPSESLTNSVDAVSRGMARKDAENEWLFLTHQHVISQVMNVDTNKKEVAVGFWDPLAKSQAKVIYFPYYEQEDQTFIKLPNTLKTALLSRAERARQRWKNRRDDQNTLTQKIPAAIFNNISVTPFQDTQKLFDELITSHKEDNFAQFISLLTRNDTYLTEEKNQKNVLEEIGQIWLRLHDIKSNTMQPLQVFEEGKIALAPLQYQKTNRPGEYTSIQIWMLKEGESWNIITKNFLIDIGGKETQRIMVKLEKRLLNIQKEYQDQRLEKLMSKVTKLKLPPELNAPSNDDATATLTEFRKLLRDKKTTAALALCSVLEDTSNRQTLKLFNYALRGAADHVEDDQIMGITQSGKWTGISVKTVSKTSIIADYPLYVIVSTAKGNKVLLDIDLRHATNRGRELINSKTWKRLGKELAQENLTDMKKLFEEHQKLSQVDIAKNSPLKNSE